ncbi:MAG: hypothetical protein ABIR78_08405 [Ferruginibacter sp.]
MKQIIAGIAIVFLFASCKNENRIIVSASFIDSLVTNYSDTAIRSPIEANLLFWKARIDPSKPGFVNELQYAAVLVQHFNLTGDINDLATADSILYTADRAYNHKVAGPNLALLRNSILQHRFKDADSLLQLVRSIDIKKYESAVYGFDVAFELGYYLLAETELKKIADPKDYGYNFRHAKLAHYNGEMDMAIASMHQSSILAENNMVLKQAALSNEADLNLHSGNLQQANDLYVQSIRLYPADLHSIMGLGWIALVHDKNDSLAQKIFDFVRSKTKAPDVIFKLTQLADARGDSSMQKKYANEFLELVTKPAYGNMYNKYIIELYTGILQEPAKAEALAKRELLNRTTPQTYAWYVWSLFCNNKTMEAEKVYQEHVSGKPLEGLELYWMGKYMQAQNKGYNAKQFYKAANKNRYDLSPSMVKDLEESLRE